MMSKIKVAMLAGLMATMASSVVVSTASAEWLVNGTKMIGSAALVPLPLIDVAPVIEVPGKSVAIRCNGPVHLIRGRIFQPNDIFIERIIFLDCFTIAPSPTACKLTNNNLETIETTALLGFVTATTHIRTRAASGKVFANVNFFENPGSERCVFEGEIPIQGEVTLGVPDNNHNKFRHLFEGQGATENSSLETAGNPTLLKGALLVGLLNEQTWAFD